MRSGADRLETACPQTLKLVAIDPAHAGELSLAAITLETVCHALRNGAGTIDPEYRLMRDHWDSPWNHAKIAVAEPRTRKPQPWYVACLHPQNMRFAGGQPLWFWLDWFEGKHVLSELQTERGGSTEREFFISARAAPRKASMGQPWHGSWVASAIARSIPIRARSSR